MGEIRQEMADEVTSRQAGITALFEELGGLEEGDPRYEAVFAQLVEAGSTLLEYEASIPAKLQEPHVQASKTVLRWATRVHLLGAGLLALTPLTGWISWWWLVLAAIQALVGFLVSVMEPRPDKHRQLRYAAVFLSVVTVLVPLLVFDLVPLWCWIVAIGCSIASFAIAVESAPTGSGKGAPA